MYCRIYELLESILGASTKIVTYLGDIKELEFVEKLNRSKGLCHSYGTKGADSLESLQKEKLQNLLWFLGTRERKNKLENLPFLSFVLYVLSLLCKANSRTALG